MIDNLSSEIKAQPESILVSYKNKKGKRKRKDPLQRNKKDFSLLILLGHLSQESHTHARRKSAIKQLAEYVASFPNLKRERKGKKVEQKAILQIYNNNTPIGGRGEYKWLKISMIIMDGFDYSSCWNRTKLILSSTLLLLQNSQLITMCIV